MSRLRGTRVRGKPKGSDLTEVTERSRPEEEDERIEGTDDQEQSSGRGSAHPVSESPSRRRGFRDPQEAVYVRPEGGCEWKKRGRGAGEEHWKRRGILGEEVRQGEGALARNEGWLESRAVRGRESVFTELGRR